MRLVAALTMSLALAGCRGGDNFSPGKWTVRTWLQGASSPAQKTEGPSSVVELSKEDAVLPPKSVFFANFYHGVQGADVRFARGEVAGRFQQPEVAPIAGHEVPIRGTYDSDSFHIEFDFTVFGMQVRQVVEGRLVDPAA